VLLYGDFPRGAAGELFQKEHPDRVYDVGIAEANLITTAAGLAGGGYLPFTHCHSIFAVGRAYNQIRQNVAFDRLNVKIILCNSGMLWPFMGGSHQMIEEIAALRVIPNIVLASPADPVSTKKATRAIAEHDGPAALRISSPAVPTVYRDDFPFALGKAVTLTDGSDATIISTGMMLSDALEATDMLAKEGIKVRLLDMHTLRPMDVEAIAAAADRPRGTASGEHRSQAARSYRIRSDSSGPSSLDGFRNRRREDTRVDCVLCTTPRARCYRA